MQKEIENPVGPEPQIIYSASKPAMVIQKYWGGIRNGKVQKSLLTSSHINSVRMKTKTNKQKLQPPKTFVTSNFEKALKEAVLV